MLRLAAMAEKYTDKPWDFSSAAYTVEQLARAVPAAVRAWASDRAKREEREVVKGDLKLPYREPDGTINVNAVRNALAVLGGARGGVDLPSDVQNKARAELQSVLAAYREQAQASRVEVDLDDLDARAFGEPAAKGDDIEARLAARAYRPEWLGGATLYRGDPIKILTLGTYNKPGWRSPLKVTSKFLADIVRTTEAVMAAGQPVPMDYNHASLEEGEVSKAAGWIEPGSLEVRDGALWATPAYTRRAAEMVAAGEFAGVSVDIHVQGMAQFGDKTIQGPMLKALALTNRPLVHGMAAGAPLRLNDRKEDTMDRTKLIEALGLAEDATDEQILDEIKALKSVPEGVELKDGETPAAAVKRLTGELAEARAAADERKRLLSDGEKAMVQMSETIKTLTEKVEALEDERASREAADRVHAAMAEGKIVPAQEEWALGYAKADPEGFECFVAAQPRVVEVGIVRGGVDRSGLEHGGPEADPDAALAKAAEAILSEHGWGMDKWDEAVRLAAAKDDKLAREFRAALDQR